MLNWSEILLAALLVALVTLLLLRLRRRIAARLLVRVSPASPLLRLANPLRHLGFPAAGLELSRDMARARRRRIAEYLEPFGGLPGSPLAEVRIPPRPFREVPLSDRWDMDARFASDEAAPFGHLASLRWQLQADQFLLFQRVSDALSYLGLKEWTILLLRDEDRFGKLPWRVLVESSAPKEASLALRAYESWLGIGVSFAEAEPESSVLGRCSYGHDGLEGVVAGFLRREHGDSAALTCLHVVSSTCPILLWPSRPADLASYLADGNHDAALLGADAPSCFHEARRRSLLRVSPASTTEIERLRDERVLVTKHPPSGMHGTVECYAQGFRAGVYLYSAIHVLVLPTERPFALQHDFSVPGDSGSWVIDGSTGSWVGMVVAGRKARHSKGSYVAPAEQLLEMLTMGLREDLHPYVANGAV